MPEFDEITELRDGDRAFKPSANFRRDAQPDTDLAARRWMIPDGFKRAGDCVIQEAVGDSSRIRDWLFYPAAYLYRHYIELSLKNLILDGSEVLDRTLLRNALDSHDLRSLWREVRRILEAVWPHGEPSTLHAAEQIILEFHRIDPTGQGFRYAANKTGGPFLGELPQAFCLQNLAQTMDGLHNFLEGALCGITELLADIPSDGP